ncbi:uncharacterized protein LOC114782609 [Denticeps clupeoides]|uniref:uncharacterized protein LOC114782609 n=1 Tax=Denticeps clupeoides TaxID=299321 RepID=UPI0010A2B6BA|nr:uncharacterized protein LOC114782609 [Denticeps clupeoides]
MQEESCSSTMTSMCFSAVVLFVALSLSDATENPTTPSPMMTLPTTFTTKTLSQPVSQSEPDLNSTLSTVPSQTINQSESSSTPSAAESQPTVSSTTYVLSTFNKISTLRPSQTASGGLIILFFLILTITVLFLLLFILRKKSRSFSFDLTSPEYDQTCDTPLQEQFQPKNTDASSRPELLLDDCGPVSTQLANGSSAAVEAASQTGCNKEVGVAESLGSEDGFHLDLLSPAADTELTLDLDLCNALSTGNPVEQEEQLNENNNNLAVMGPADLSIAVEEDFTEISLN